MKFVCRIEFVIWTIVWRKLTCHNDIITYSILKFKHKSSRAYLTDIPNSISIGHKRAEIHVGKLTKVMKKNGFNVTVTLTFDPRSPISIRSEPVR